MPRVPSSLRTATVALLLSLAPSVAAADDSAFFDRIEGQWSGPGQIVAGKYKGTRFSCALAGSSLDGNPGMTLDGTCRVGLFNQPVSAVIEAQGRSYTGRFLDGAKGNGLDVVSGNVAGDRVTVGMEREQLRGAMVARVKPGGKLGVTVSVRVGDELVPVVALDLTRGTDGMATGSVR